jgi:hypothetical protein
MLKVYELNVSEIDILSVINDEINFMLVKIFSIWTISSLLDSIYFVPLLSSSLILYNKYYRKGEWRDIVIMGMVGLLCMVCDSYFLISFLCQCLPKLLFNDLTFKIYKKSKKYLGSRINDLMALYYDEKFINMVSFIGYMGINKLLIGSHKILIFETNNILVLTNAILNVLVIKGDNKLSMINILIIFTSFKSNFNIWHVIFNTIITFLIFDLNINIHDTKEYLISECYYQYEKKDIWIKIFKNLWDYVLRRCDIDKKLYDELLLNTRNKSKSGIVIIDGFVLNDKNIVEVDCKKKYDVIDDYMLSDDNDSDTSLKESSLEDSNIDIILSDIKYNTNKMQRIKSTGPVEVIDNYFNHSS